MTITPLTRLFAVTFAGLLLSLQAFAGQDACTRVDQHRDPVTGAMRARIERVHVLPKNPGTLYLATLNADSKYLVGIAQQLIQFHVESASEYHRLDRVTAAGKQISTKEMDDLLKVEQKRQSMTKVLRQFIEKYRCEMFKYDLAAYESAKGFWAYRMAALLLSAHSLMSDTLLSYALIIQHNPTLRHVLNSGANTYDLSANSLQREMSNHFAIIHRDDWEWAIDVHQAMLRRRERFPKVESEDMRNFDIMVNLINNSVTVKNRLAQSYFERIVDDIVDPIDQRIRHGHLIEDSFFNGIYNIVTGLSLAFGHTIAQIQFKDGLMYKRPELESAIVRELSPGDILWDKTRYKVSGMLIPGHWNHNALWIGSKQELQALGIWEHEYIRPYQRQIEEGKSVVEALRYGVVLNTMEHFMNIDDIAVARKREPLSAEEQRQVILRAMRYMGTPYGFNFDIARADTVICSQLVMIAYPEIEWKQEKLIGNWSTTPDLLAQETLSDGPLAITQLYHNAERINENTAAVMKDLLKL